MSEMIHYVVPSLDASTFEGQMQWFMCGFIYSSVVASVALMIRLFKGLGQTNPDL